MNQSIINPCISICKTDPLTGFCYGCGRTNAEKIAWKEPDTSTKWKLESFTTSRKRLTGWQKDAFDKSYLNKKETGMSLLQQKLKESKV